jgi:hypothetical protein
MRNTYMFDYIHRAQRTMRYAVLGAALLGFSACGGAEPTGPGNGGNPVGTYVLELVDDEELPVAVYHDSYLDPETGIFFNQFVMEVRNGYIEIRENETFYMSLQMRVTGDGVVFNDVFEFEGEWDEFKDQIILRVQVPFVDQLVLDRDGSWLGTEIDFMGFGEEWLLEFKR